MFDLVIVEQFKEKVIVADNHFLLLRCELFNVHIMCIIQEFTMNHAMVVSACRRWIVLFHGANINILVTHV